MTYLWCLVPIIVAYVAVIKSKKAFESCLLGIIAGLVIYAFQNPGNWNLALTGYNMLSDVCSDPGNVWVIVFTLIIGCFTEILSLSHATGKFTEWVAKHANTEKKTLFTIIIMGVLVFADEFLKAVILDSYVMRIGKKNKISIQTIGFLVVALCIPLVILMPYTTWSVYFSNLMEGAGFTTNGSMDYILHVIPNMYFPVVLMVVVILFACGVIPAMGNIKKAKQQIADGTYDWSVYDNVETDTAPVDDKHRESSMIDFVIPLLVLFVSTFLNAGDLGIGIIITLCFMLVWYLLRKVMNFNEYMDAFYKGMNEMVKPTAYLMLGFTFSSLVKAIGFGDLIQAIAGILVPGAVLAFFFIAAFLLGTSTGMFWPTTSLFLAACLPVTDSMGISPFVLCGVLFSAAAFGTAVSPRGALIMLIGDELHSNAVDVMKDARPYVLISGAITLIGYLILGFFVV